MANSSGISWGVDLYRAVVFPLDADGKLLATSTTVYEGLEFEGSRIFEITPAEARAVENYGDGRVRDVIYLPPNNSNKGVLRVGYGHQTIKAALTGVKQTFLGESARVHRGTDQQGNEPMVALLLMQLAHDVNKLKRWRYYMIPRAQCIPQDSSFNESGTEDLYQISMSPSAVEIWNHALTVSDEGCTEAAYSEGVSEGRIKIVAWLGDGNEDEFLFPALKPAIATAKISVFDWTTGVEHVSGVTKAVDKLTFDYPPTGLQVAKYEF